MSVNQFRIGEREDNRFWWRLYETGPKTLESVTVGRVFCTGAGCATLPCARRVPIGSHDVTIVAADLTEDCGEYDPRGVWQADGSPHWRRFRSASYD